MSIAFFELIDCEVDIHTTKLHSGEWEAEKDTPKMM